MKKERKIRFLKDWMDEEKARLEGYDPQILDIERVLYDGSIFKSIPPVKMHDGALSCYIDDGIFIITKNNAIEYYSVAPKENIYDPDINLPESGLEQFLQGNKILFDHVREALNLSIDKIIRLQKEIEVYKKFYWK